MPDRLQGRLNSAANSRGFGVALTSSTDEAIEKLRSRIKIEIDYFSANLKSPTEQQKNEIKALLGFINKKGEDNET